MNKDLFERSQRVVPGGVHSPVRALSSLKQKPLFFKKAFGPYLKSITGATYIDFCMSFGPLILGHRDEEVSEVIQEGLSKIWTVGAAEPYSLELAEWICSRIPFIEKIRFVSSGTEAVMSALRLARAKTLRSKILKFEGCYHGHVDSMLVQAGSGLAGLGESSSLGIPPSVVSDTLVAPLDNEDALENVFNQYASEIAAVIVEPLPANYGLLPQREEFIRKIFSLAKKSGSLVIFDEVISGFRVGIGGMAEKWGFFPDLVCYGKVIGGGFPVGAFGGRADIMDLVAPLGQVYQAGTLSAHPMAMMAGLSTLKKLERDQVPMKLEKKTNLWIKKLNQKIKEKNLNWRVIQFSSLFWFSRGEDSSPRSIHQISKEQTEAFKSFFSLCLKKNIYLSPSPYEVHFNSLAHSEEVLDRASHAFLQAML